MTLFQIGMAIFAASFLCVLTVLLIAGDRMSSRNRRVRQRLSAILERRSSEDTDGFILLRDTSFSTIPFLDRFLSRFQFVRHVQKRCDEAGLPIKAGMLILGMLSLGGLVGLIVSALIPSVLVALAATGAAGMIPYLWVLNKRQKRIDRFEELLPEAIDLIVNALRSGFSLEAALSLTAQEIPDPLGTEFALTFEEQNIGLDLGQALENMNHRMPSLDLKIMTTAVTIQKRTGGNLAEILGTIGEMIRERFTLRRDIRIFTAQGRLSGMVLAALPLAMVAILYVLSPEYLEILVTDEAGQMMILVAVVLQIIGFLFIRKIVQVKI